MAKRRRSLKRRKNFLPAIAVVPLLKGLAVGIGVLGAGLAIYQYTTFEDHSPKVQSWYKQAKKMLDYAADGGDEANQPLSGSIIQPPTNLGFAWAQVAFYCGRAYVKTKDPLFLQIGQEYLDKFMTVGIPGEEWISDQKISQALLEGASKMEQSSKSHLAQQEINLLVSNADPQLIQSERTEQGKIEVDPYEPWRKTIEEAGAPFTLGAGLVTGKCPMGWDCTTFRLIQVAVYGSLALGAYSLVKSYLPKLPSKD